jgi:hypothetical protein
MVRETRTGQSLLVSLLVADLTGSLTRCGGAARRADRPDMLPREEEAASGR